jgi:cytochrome P450
MAPDSKTPRIIIESRSPNLIQIALQIREKGALQFFVDQRSIQGDLPQVRMGLHKLFLVFHPDHVRHVLLTNRQSFEKLQTWETTRQLMLGDGLIAANGPLWKRQRRLMSTFFTPRSIEQYYRLMVTAADVAIKRWDSIAQAGHPVDMFDEMTRVTAWIILRSMFGMDMSEERLRSMEGGVETLIQFVNRREMLPVKAPLWAPLPSHRRYREAKARVDSLIHEIIVRRRAEPQSSWPNDLLSKLMSVRDEETGEAMSDQLVRDECLGIFVAGHETTARTLSFLWYALHENPEVAKRLRAELDSVVPQGQAPALEHFQQLPYMDRVLKEVLRLYPPAPAVPRDPITDQTLDGVHIPAGTFLLVFPYITHRHPDFWDEPERFDPDRFLPEKEAAFHDYAYYPFGGGNRLCLGSSFAMLEMKILTTMLVSKFEARLVEGHKPRIDIGGTLMVRNGLPMRITRRP